MSLNIWTSNVSDFLLRLGRLSFAPALPTTAWILARSVGKADLLEEIARIYGYERIPEARLRSELPPQRGNPVLEGEEHIIDILVNQGLQEIISHRQTTPEREAAIVFVNDEASKIMGYSRDEALAMSAWDFFEPSELAVIQERYRQRQRGEQVTSYYETNVLHKNGKYIPIEISLSIMNYRDKIATVVFFKDMTEHKLMEKELDEVAEKKDSWVKTVNDFYVPFIETSRQKKKR
jgi:PAS domain S-box-containing protein